MGQKTLLGVGTGKKVLILDQFVGTNGTVLSSHTISPTNTPNTSWSVNANFTIQGNQASASAADTEVFCNPGVSNLTATATITETTGAGIILRATDGSNFWLAYVPSANNIFKITEKLTGTYTDRATVSLSVSGSNAFSLQASGAALTAKLNNANTLTFSSTDLQTSTQAGLYSGSGPSASTWANFQVTVP